MHSILELENRRGPVRPGDLGSKVRVPLTDPMTRAKGFSLCGNRTRSSICVP